MQPDYKLAVRLALSEKRLWAAGLITALAFSEAWWIVFDWGPEYLGERWERAIGDWLGGAAALAAFVLAALAAFVVLKAVGYLGEMVLVRQVADGEAGEVPGFSGAFSSSRHRYLLFAATLLPWDALRIALVYLPALIIAAWGRWDPRLDHVFLYILAILVWFALLIAAYIFAGIPATMAARSSLLREKGIPWVWREGWCLFRGNAGICLAVWLQVLLADIAFVAIAWPLSALLPWAVGQLVDPVGFAPARWLILLLAYTVLAGSLIVMRVFVQVFKSSLWTATFLQISMEGESRTAPLETAKTDDAAGAFRPPPTDIPEPPPDFLPPK